MLNICGEYKKLWDIKFNLEKSSCCTLGGNRPQYGNVELAFKPLHCPVLTGEVGLPWMLH